MRLLMVTPSLKKTGPINVAFNLCESIRKIDGNIVIDLLSFNHGELENNFLVYCNQVLVMSPFQAIRYVSNNNTYDIVHSHCVLPDFINAFFVKNARKFSTLHNYINIDYVSEMGFLKGSLISLLQRWCLKKIDCVIACSESVSNFVLNNFNLKTTFVRNGVSEGKGGTSTSSIQRYIMVGVFNKRKNHEVAIQGFVDAKKKNAELILLGDGPYLKHLSKKFSNEKNVTFLGNVSNPRHYMSQSDVFLSSSCAEGLPMALIEAMSESLTYILSDIEPHREIHNMNVFSGIIIKNDVQSFKNSISSLEHDDIIKMKLLSNKVYSEELTVDKMALGYISKYKGEL